MKNANTTSYLLLFTFTCFLLTPNITHSMETEISEEKQIVSSWPKDIHGKIVTTILDLYLDELEAKIDYYEEHIRDHKWDPFSIFPYEEHGKNIIDKIIYWVACRNFLPTLYLNSQSTRGNTLLHHATMATLRAVTTNKPEILLSDFINYLLRQKANLDIQNNENDTILSCCVNKLESVLNTKEHNPEIEKMINMFLDAGANPNATTENNFLLHILPHKAFCPTIERILKLTNYKEYRCRDNHTLSFWASLFRNIKLLEFLYDSGIDIFAQEPNGEYGLKCIKQDFCILMKYEKSQKIYAEYESMDEPIRYQKIGASEAIILFGKKFGFKTDDPTLFMEK